ncbi:MAG: integrase arm-type DNA-binding domain-containing protein [Pseudomonadota bacterium]
MRKLTQAMVETAEAPDTGQTFVWDGYLKGFGVRVGTTGTKSYVIQYRNSEGRLRRLAFARHPVFKIDQAREQARILIGKIASGEDPAEDKRANRKAATVAEICDWYLEEASSGRLLGVRRRPIKPSTLAMDRSRIERHIKPLIGTRQVKKLRLADIERLQADIASGNTAAKKRDGRGRVTTGGNGAASRTISTLHSVFEHAVRLGELEGNPARGVRRLAANKRTRRLSAAELVTLGRVMREAPAKGEHPVGLAAVRLILLTGFRLMEGQRLQRNWLDADNCVIGFPDTKSDAQVRAIGKPALDLIMDQPELKGSAFVFTADDGISHYKQVPDVIVRLCHAARIEGVTAHTLRHTFGSVAGDLGFSEIIIQAMLGHGKRGVTQGYIHVDEALRHAIEKVSCKIADLLDGRAKTIRSATPQAAT